MVRATDEKVVARAMNHASRHAVRHHKTIHDVRAAGNSPTACVGQPGIDFIDAPDIRDRNGILVRQQQVTSIGIPRHSSQTRRGYSASARAAGCSLVSGCESTQALIKDGTM